MCVRLPHACQRFVTLSMRNAIYTFGKKYTRWEAVFPGKFVAVLTCHLIYHLSRRSKTSAGLLLTAFVALVGALLVSRAFLTHATRASGSDSFIGNFHRVSTIASTVPGNGDVNPYGTVVVQRSIGKLTQGDVLVSNFNNKANLQGTGTQVAKKLVDRTVAAGSPPGAGCLFGLAVRDSSGVYFVDDCTNALNLLH